MRNRIRLLALSLAVTAGPVAAVLAVTGPPASPAPTAGNFACASVGQVNVRVCVGPPINFSIPTL